MSTEESWELELDSEEYRVRRHRQTFLERAGFSEFAAFRLSMQFDIPKERAAELLETAPSEDWVLDQLID